MKVNSVHYFVCMIGLSTASTAFCVHFDFTPNEGVFFCLGLSFFVAAIIAGKE